MTPLNTNKKDLRTFGLVMAGAFAALGAFLWWKTGFALWTAYLSGGFALLGLIAPRALAPIEWVWMKLAHVLGYVMTRVLLTLVYILAVTPIGLVFKGLRKDLLQRKFDPNAQSYWIEAEDDGPWTRPDKPY